MANDPNSSGDQNSSYLNQDDSEKSLVGKFKSIISNTPLSKWFLRQENDSKSTIRRRDEESYEEEIDQLQPPTKRAKFAVSKGNDVSELPIKTSDSVIKDKLINRNYNFPEPVAGSSGLQSRKLLNSVGTPLNSDINVHLFGSEFLNGHKDSDSEESTSGYSSVPRIGSKEHVCQSEGSSKQPSPLQNNSPDRRSLFETSTAGNASRSLFTEITSPQMNTSMSSRRPKFNASTFGSPNFIDQTLSTERVISSPFYNGSTIYGGASAYGNKFDRRTKDLRNSFKRSVHIKPIKKSNESGSLVLGKTARKILETLEQYSTPINDAKKIPVASKRVRLDTGLLGQHVGFKPYSLQSDTASNRELQVPTVSDLLKMKQKAKLQSSTEAVRQIATSSKTDVNIHSKPVKTVNSNVVLHTVGKPKEPTPIGQPQVLPSLPVPALPKLDVIPSTTKKISDKLLEPTAVIPPKVMNVQKPIVEQAPLKLQSVQQPVVSGGTKKVTQKEHITSTHFKFSDPLIIAENLKNIVAMNNFKFSEPLSNLNKPEHAVNKQYKEKNNGQTVIKDAPNWTLLDKVKPEIGTWKCETCLIRNQSDKTKCEACQSPKSKPLETDPSPNSSLLNKFKPASGTWECNTCLIRNQPDKVKCVACETPKLKAAVADPLPNSSLLNKFKPASGTWECSTCLIRNQPDKTKCVACETPKLKPVQIETKKSSFGDNFKMPENMWECPVCMIRNSNDSAKCVACETINPKTSTVVSSSSSNFGKKFQPPSNTWECSTCLIRNKEDVEKCAACETPRVTKKHSTSDLVNSFKIKADEWECSVCMVRNKEINSKCQCCGATKPGSSTFVMQETEKKPVPKFNFGIDKTAAMDFKFGIQPNTTTTTSAEPVVPKLPEPSSVVTKSDNVTTPTFSFGVTPIVQKKTEIVEPLKPAENKLASSNSTSVTAPEKAEVVPASEQNPSSSTLANKIKDGKNPSTTITDAFSAKPAFTSPKEQPQAEKKIQFIPPTTIKSTVSSSKSEFSFGTSASVKPTSSTSSLFVQNKPPTSGNNGLNANPISTFGIPNKASGDVSSTKPAETKPFSFTKPDSNGEPAASKAPMFNFGQTATQAVHTATTKSSGFNFGQVTKSPFLNFSATDKKTETSTPSTFTFIGSGTEASKNGPFNFGGSSQNTAAQKAGFNFGSVSTTPASSGFNFDGASATNQAAPTSGFNFSSTFDANTKPTFNFSSERSVVTFSAQPSGDGGAAAPRKIKRGVRRAQR